MAKIATACRPSHEGWELDCYVFSLSVHKWLIILIPFLPNLWGKKYEGVVPTKVREENTNSVNYNCQWWRLSNWPGYSSHTSSPSNQSGCRWSWELYSCKSFQGTPRSPPCSLSRRSIDDLRREACEHLLNRLNITMRLSPPHWKAALRNFS